MIKDLCSSEIIILSHFSGLTLKLLVQYSLMNSSRMSVIFSVGSTIFRVMLSRLIGQMGYAHTALKSIVMRSITYNMKMLNIIHFTMLMRHSVFSTQIPWLEMILQAFTKIDFLGIGKSGSKQNLCNHDYPFNYILQVENLGSKRTLAFLIWIGETLSPFIKSVHNLLSVVSILSKNLLFMPRYKSNVAIYFVCNHPCIWRYRK